MPNLLPCLGLLASTSIALAGPPLVGPLPQTYAKLGDSALFGLMSLDDDFYCETFEDGTVNTPGLNLVGGNVLGPGPTTDSVDGDDGSVDGSGSGGRSYRSGGTPITMTWSAGPLGGLPERVAFAWTDGAASAPVTLTVLTGSGSSTVHAIGPFGDASESGTTAEDRLIAITSSDGIAQVTVSAAGTAFEIDHVQYEDPVTADSGHWNQHDFSDDSRDDVLWFSPTAGSAATWLMNGLVREGGGAIATPVPATWEYVGVGATDVSGKAFVFWRDTVSGLIFVWKLSGNEIEPEGLIENAGAVTPEWKVIAVADVDGDVDADLVFRNTVTGTINVWLLQNHTRVGGGFLKSSAGLEYLGCGDLNGDRRDDLLWRDGTGTVRGWLLNGGTVWKDDVVSGTAAISDDWSVEAIGDLDGDRSDDVVWRNASSGTVSAWRMTGLHRAGGGVVALNVPGIWALDGVADLDGNGKDDLLWKQGITNQVNGWVMDGLSKSSSGFIRFAGPGWSICNR